jgi:phosphoglycolate phosphatase-like HAD superfamily hydrolase
MVGIVASGQGCLQSHPRSPVRFVAPTTVFCDFDGPIVDVSDRYYNTYRLGLAEVQASDPTKKRLLPVHRLTKAQFWQMKQERTPDREIAMRSGLRGEQIDQFLHQVSQIVNQPTLLHQDRLQPGVKWALESLHAQGTCLILVTLRCQVQAIQILQNHGLAHLFSQVWGAQDHSAAYTNYADHKTQLLAAAIAACPQASLYQSDRGTPSAWMIGDTEADILAGQAMNVPTIGLTCGIRSQTYLQKFAPTHIHSDLASAVRRLVRPCQAA